MITAAGFYYAMSERDYHADPAPNPSLSSSIARLLIDKSPAHGYLAHPRLGAGTAEDGTAEMDFGELAHKLMLGKGAEIAEFTGDSWRGKEAGLFWDNAKAAGKIPSLTKNIGRARDMVQAARVQLETMGLGYVFSDQDPEGQSEVAAFWQEGETWCRALMDRIIIGKNGGTVEIFDLKTMSQSAHPKACAARVASMGYDLQKAHYHQGVQKLLPEFAGRISFTFIFVETTAPFAVTPVKLNGEWSAIGLSKWSRALSLWQSCVANNKWPAYTDKVLDLDAPSWALPAEMGA